MPAKFRSARTALGVLQTDLDAARAVPKSRDRRSANGDAHRHSRGHPVTLAGAKQLKTAMRDSRTSGRSRAQDGARVAVGQTHETSYTAKKGGASRRRNEERDQARWQQPQPSRMRTRKVARIQSGAIESGESALFGRAGAPGDSARSPRKTPQRGEVVLLRANPSATKAVPIKASVAGSGICALRVSSASRVSVV
jgi:hypothetical protein